MARITTSLGSRPMAPSSRSSNTRMLDRKLVIEGQQGRAVFAFVSGAMQSSGLELADLFNSCLGTTIDIQ